MEPSAVKRGFGAVVGARDREVTEGALREGSTLLGFRVRGVNEREALLLEGEHRFSRYELNFRLGASAGRTTLCAETRAEFPGMKGQFYKTLVIRSRGHVLVTRSILKAVKRRAERPAR
jgi:hypothetical protein